MKRKNCLCIWFLMSSCVFSVSGTGSVQPKSESEYEAGLIFVDVKDCSRELSPLGMSGHLRGVHWPIALRKTWIYSLMVCSVSLVKEEVRVASSLEAVSLDTPTRSSA